MEVQVLFRAPIFLFLLFFSTNSSAELQITKLNDDLILHSQDCIEMGQEISDFVNLSIKYEDRIDEVKINCKNQTYNLSKILPQKILNLMSNNSEYYGPNCWNSVLVANGILPSIRFSKSDELEYIYKNYCKQVVDYSKVSAGDIFRIFNEKKEDFHSFIYISPNFSFSKDGPETKSSYQIEKTDLILKNYGILGNCFDKNKKISKTCFDLIEVYDCSHVKRSAAFDKKYSGIINLIEQLEKNLGNLLQHYRDIPNQDKRLLLSRQLMQNQKTLMFIVNENLNEYQDSAEDSLELKFLYLRLDSIAEQLSFF